MKLLTKSNNKHAPKMTPIKFEFDAIGTHWIIDLLLSEDLNPVSILNKIHKRIDIFDKTYSRFRQDSLVSHIASKKGSYTLPPDAKKLFNFYRSMYDATQNNVTPLIGQTLVDAGYDTEYSFKTHKLHQPPMWDDILHYEYPNLKVKKPVLLDFGAAGKGYLIDIIAELLRKDKIKDFCIDAGGDIKHSSSVNKFIKVGLEHPDDFSKVIGVSEISNKSICGSSVNRRNWGEYNHIINPYTLSSPNNILSTWAIASDCILADGMATCLFFVSGKKLYKLFDFEYLILYSNYTYEISPKFPGEVYTDKVLLKTS